MHLLWTPVPPSLTLPPGQSAARWGFLLVAAGTSAEAQAAFDQGLELMATGDLRPAHQKAWKELWLHSTVEVVGSESLRRALIGCLFYLLSAFPSIHQAPGSFGGVSPGGLSNGGDGQDYCGHVFWDQVGFRPTLSALSWRFSHGSDSASLRQDIWVYPGIALFYPDLARAVLEYRVRTIEGAKHNAQKQGYQVSGGG